MMKSYRCILNISKKVTFSDNKINPKVIAEIGLPFFEDIRDA